MMENGRCVGPRQRQHPAPAAAASAPAGNCCFELVLRVRLASSSSPSSRRAHMASATRPLVPGERASAAADREPGPAATQRADAMSVSFDAIRTEPDAIWRPIAALRPTRCHRPPNYARITQQLGGYVCVCNASPVGIVCRWTTQVEVV